MGSFDWLSPGSRLGRFLRRMQSARGDLLARRPAVRWTLAAAALAVIVLLAYLGAGNSGTAETAFLNAGRRFGPEDLSKIGRALDRQRIPHHIDDDRRVVIAPSKREQAEEVVAKLDLGPRLPGEVRDQASISSPWESPRDREQREHQEQARILELMINDLPGIVGSFVRVNRPKAGLGLKPAGKSSAFVRLETDGDRQLPFRTVQTITTILTGNENGLSPDAITVVDRRGHKYLVAGNPELSALSSNRAHEEELSQKLLEQLDWIKGVRVSVQLPVVVEAPQPAGPAAKGGERPAPPADPARKPAPAVALNRAMSLEPEPSAADAPTPPRATEPTPGGTVVAPPQPAAEPGRVWVRVPRSFYYQVSLLPGHKEPSRDDLLKLVSKTEEQIRRGIDLIMPSSGQGAWKATVDIIQDELPAADATSVSDATGRRPVREWGIAAALGAMAAMVVALASWALHALRPVVRRVPAPSGLRYDVGTSDATGPSERVREFVRRNPEAAVSVLERWTSQGGSQA